MNITENHLYAAVFAYIVLGITSTAIMRTRELCQNGGKYTNQDDAERNFLSVLLVVAWPVWLPVGIINLLARLAYQWMNRPKSAPKKEVKRPEFDESPDYRTTAERR